MSTSVTALAAAAEHENLRRAMNDARRHPIPRAELLDGLQKQISGKVWWLDKFGDGKKWSRSDVDSKRQQLAELVQARDLLLAMPSGGGANGGRRP